LLLEVNYENVFNDYYGTVYVPLDVFERLNSKFFISSTTDTAKFMCANGEETDHLISLGIEITELYDYYKIILEEL